MPASILDLFRDEEIQIKIKSKLPKLFQIAELESQRAGRIGMEVGSLRERILVALLVFYFGEEEIDSEIPITEPEIDVKINDVSVSIKTKSGSGYGGVKLIWTVDAENAADFRSDYNPSMGMLYTHINWGAVGGLYYFSQELQQEVLDELGRERYIKMPAIGTNPRGVEISSEAFRKIVNHHSALKIEITWEKEEITYNAFERWIELWAQD